VYRVDNPQRAKETIRNFFASFSQVYNVTPEITETFGKLRAELKQQGKALEDLDLLIAATCLSEHIPLLTNNTKHFSRIPGLILV
jgi:predicted nucleic acid-binding protein